MLFYLSFGAFLLTLYEFSDMTLSQIALSIILLASCSSKLNEPSGGVSGGGKTPPTPIVAEIPEGALYADGNDEGTYELIQKCGYNYETPDLSGNHANESFRHIRQIMDTELNKYVFDFYLHIDNDDDRGLPNIKDRQRNEIKTDNHSPKSMVAQKGETLTMSWKFKLPSGFKTTTKFSHIHQLKGIDNKDGNADVGLPLITFTARSMSSGGQQLQIIYTSPASEGSKLTYLKKLDLSSFLGEWVEVTETVCFDTEGSYSVKIKRISDGKLLVELNNQQLNLWREGATGLRPKWGLYRSFGTNGELKPQLRDEVLKFADFLIEK